MIWGRPLATLVGLGLAVLRLPAAAPNLSAADEAFFESRVRPLLAEHCGECHLGGKAKGGLQLDSRAALLRGGDAGPAALPGNPAASRLLRAVQYTDPDLRMPPRTRLEPAAVAVLEEWIQRGLPDPRPESTTASLPLATRPPRAAAGEHWAFRARQVSSPPRLSGVADPVDRFLLARLQDVGLRYAPAAEARTWVRRVTLDLTGLPATDAEVESFLQDTRPDARERWVDTLLARPAYGERWGRWWLDVARYADTNGQDENKVMGNAWRYRDWVVAALNANLPYDQFLTDQVAGDLLPEAQSESPAAFDHWTATGFLVLGPKLLAEQDKSKLVFDIIDEQLDTLGRSVLGLTLGCARCHDHKFDPVSQREYYALAGIFGSTRTMENLAFVSKFNERHLTSPTELAARAVHSNALQQATTRVQIAVQSADSALRDSWRAALPRALAAADGHLPTDLPAGLAERVQRARTNDHPAAASLRALAGQPEAAQSAVARWIAARSNPDLVTGHPGAAFNSRGTNSLSLPAPAGPSPTSFTVSAWVRPDPQTTPGDSRRWLVSRAANEWADGHLALLLEGDRPGAYVNLGGGQERVFAAWGPEGSTPVHVWHHLATTFDGSHLRLFVDGQEVAVTPAAGSLNPTSLPFVLGRRPDGYIGFHGRIDGVRIDARALSVGAVAGLAKGESPGPAWLARDFDDLSPTDAPTLADRTVAEWLWEAGGPLHLPPAAERRALYPASVQTELAVLEKELEHIQAQTPPPPAYALAVAEATVTNLPVLARGSHLNPGREAVPRGFPQLAGSLPVPLPDGRQSGRLELARWLTHPANPLTTRVLVNRVWQAHFGEGLVRTPDNFGLRGEAPTHPELLDWLAEDFLRSGWNLKALHRRLVLTAAYAQSATPLDGMVPAADPDNRLLHRYPRQRLEAEMLRDALLAVAGQLDLTLGGTLTPWKNDDYVPEDPAPFRLPRRSLYLPVVRDRGEDLFAAFDGANSSVTVARRGSTVVSPQALYLMNAPLVREAAAGLTKRVWNQDATERLDQLYRRAYARPPRPGEIERANRFLSDDRLHALPEEERWTALAQVLLAANEFTHRE